MKKRIFKHGIIAAFLSLVLILSVISLPAFIANAEPGTLGTESPAITASYQDADGKAADGNKLSAGTYKMTVTLSGMKAVSVLQFDAAYDESVLSFDNVKYSLMDTYAYTGVEGFHSGGKLIFGYFSTNLSSTTEIDPNGTELFSLDVTVVSEAPVDIEDYITMNKSPDLTFIEADYGDIRQDGSTDIHDCYALEQGDTFLGLGTVYSMTCDLSPEFTEFSVSGKVVVMLNPNKPDETNNAKGLDNVEIIINEETVATTDTDGNYDFMIAPGEYDATLHHQNGYDRTVKITVEASSVTAPAITLVNCDYDHNGRINAADSTSFRAGYKKKTDQANLNRDSSINASDNTIFKSFFKKNDIRDIYTSVVVK